MNLVEQHGAVALRGNHDQRLVELIRTPHAEVRTKFVEHGGVQTLNSYLNREDAQLSGDRLQEAIAFIDAAYPSHLRFLASLPYYYEDDRQICVHAGLNPQYADWRSQPAHDFMYIKKEFYKAPTRVGKKVVFGHTRAQELHGSSEIWFGGDKIGIDGGCAYGLQLNCLIEESGSYSTHAVRNPL
jgi:serine/threonine protein phosphatase 1